MHPALINQEEFHAGDKINVALDLMMSPDAVVVWTYLAALLATVVVYVCFIYRVSRLVSLQMLLKDFATGPLCEGGGHGWRRRWGVVQSGSRGSLPVSLMSVSWFGLFVMAAAEAPDRSRVWAAQQTPDSRPLC